MNFISGVTGQAEGAGAGEDYEIERLDTDDDCQFGEFSFGYYLPDDMAMSAHSPDKIRPLEGSETILISNGDHVRGVCYNGNGAYRTYAESISFIGINNEFDDDRAELSGDVIEYLADYQGNLTGTVTDLNNSQPIENAEVEIIDCNLTAETNQDGEFEFSRFPVEEFSIIVRAEGYLSYQTSYSFEGEMELNIEVLLESGNSVSEKNTHPSTYRITSVFPNRFNPSTTVFIELDQPILLKIFGYQ